MRDDGGRVGGHAGGLWWVELRPLRSDRDLFVRIGPLLGRPHNQNTHPSPEILSLAFEQDLSMVLFDLVLSPHPILDNTDMRVTVAPAVVR